MSLEEKTILISQVEDQRVSYVSGSLTGYDTDTEPSFANGSLLDQAGSLVETTSTQSIPNSSGVPNNSKAFIVVGSTFDLSYSTIEPDWDDSKLNWINDNRDIYIASVYKESSVVFNQKEILYPDIHGALDLFDIDSIEDVLMISTTTTSTNTSYKEFELLKPVSIYSDINQGGTTMGIDVWQNGAWQATKFKGQSFSQSDNMSFNPGKYRMGVNAGGPSRIGTIYIRGVYGTDSLALDKVVITT